MKKILVFFLTLIVSISFAIARNGIPPCNCLVTDQVNLHANGQAEWVSSTQIKCTGETGICWQLTFNGKFILTIYTDPPVVFDNHSQPDDPPIGPVVAEIGEGYIIYDIDTQVWKRQ